VIAVVGIAALALVAGPSPAAQAHNRPTTYIVTNDPGTFLEGITVTNEGTMYVTNVGTGAVYRGSTSDAQLSPFLPAGSDGRTQATGIHTDQFGRIFIAGYATGTMYVYDRSGHLLAARPAPDPNAILNDLVITRDAVYVSDSQVGVVWRAALDGPSIGNLTEWVPASAFPSPPVFLNGIVATPDGRVALVADQGTDLLFRVDLQARTASTVNVAGGTMGADGLVLEGHHLYGVVNFPNSSGGFDFAVRLADLNHDLTAGQVVAQSQPEGLDETPTTLARDRDRLLWVNSQLGNPAPAPPFTVTEVQGLH
jgi:sugar lactone lactonase YvrE